MNGYIANYKTYKTTFTFIFNGSASSTVSFAENIPNGKYIYVLTFNSNSTYRFCIGLGIENDESKVYRGTSQGTTEVSKPMMITGFIQVDAPTNTLYQFGYATSSSSSSVLVSVELIPIN